MYLARKQTNKKPFVNEFGKYDTSETDLLWGVVLQNVRLRIVADGFRSLGQSILEKLVLLVSLRRVLLLFL